LSPSIINDEFDKCPILVIVVLKNTFKKIRVPCPLFSFYNGIQ
jgi:hypothetical protein